MAVDLLEVAKGLSLKQIANLLQINEAQGAQLAQLKLGLESKDQRISELKRRTEWLERAIWGALSERRTLKHFTPAQQLYLGEQMMDIVTEPPPPKTTVKEHERDNRKKPVVFAVEDSQLKFDASVPRQTIVVPNPELEGVPEEELDLIDTRRTYRLAQRSSAYVLLEYVQHVFKRKGVEKPSCPPIPPVVYDKSSADVSFLSNMIVDKFRYHLPLYRQHQRLTQSGFYIDRSTLTRLVTRTGQLLEPIFHSLLSSILHSSVLTMDESPTPAGRTKGTDQRKGKVNQGWFWVLHGDQQEVGFMFSPSRGRAVIDDALTGFSGTLLTDGYTPYKSFVKDNPGIQHAQCWAHTRRKFIEAEKFAPEPCALVIGLLQKLYLVERRGRGNPAVLAKLRDTESRPIIDAIFEFLESEMERTAFLPSNPYVVAALYAQARQQELRLFLDDVSIPVDTNHIERTLRPAAVGRKNWMFHVTEEGARCAGIFYSLIQSCILADVDPGIYLTDVIQRVILQPAHEVQMLIPRNWKQNFGSNPLRSDLLS